MVNYRREGEHVQLEKVSGEQILIAARSGPCDRESIDIGFSGRLCVRRRRAGRENVVAADRTHAAQAEPRPDALLVKAADEVAGRVQSVRGDAFVL